jgi:hypothetical protein
MVATERWHLLFAVVVCRKDKTETGGRGMKRIGAFVLVIMAIVSLSACVLTKIVSVPLRVTGAVLSVVPVAGNTAHDAIDEAADVVDDVPI